MLEKFEDLTGKVQSHSIELNVQRKKNRLQKGYDVEKKWAEESMEKVASLEKTKQ